MILTSMDKYRNVGLLILRLGIGGLIASFGWPKITAGPTFWAQLGTSIGTLGVPVFLPVFWGFMAALAEFVGGICVALGFFFRPALFLLVCNMTVATLTVYHAGKSFQDFSRPLELLIVFFALFFIGPGRYAIDTLFGGKRG